MLMETVMKGSGRMDVCMARAPTFIQTGTDKNVWGGLSERMLNFIVSPLSPSVPNIAFAKRLQKEQAMMKCASAVASFLVPPCPEAGATVDPI